jgi:guanylate kinase
MSRHGTVFVVSAPSGSGKSTLVKRLLAEVPGVQFSISFTTRAPKENEIDGVDYCFVSRETFQQMIREGQFFEYARVFDEYYGTARASIEKVLQEGQDVILDIDTEGAAQVKQRLPQAVTVFIFPPSREALRERLHSRRRDTEVEIEKRLRWAAEVEIHRYAGYDYLIINDQLEQALEVLKGIVWAERSRTRRMTPYLEPILNSFGGQP